MVDFYAVIPFNSVDLEELLNTMGERFHLRTTPLDIAVFDASGQMIYGDECFSFRLRKAGTDEEAP